MSGRVSILRWFFVGVSALTFVLGIVVYRTEGPWYGVTMLGLMALGAGYVAIFAPDRLVVRVDRWIGAVLHWSP